MDTKVKKALEAAVNNYATIEQIDGQSILPGLASAFELEAPFMEKVDAMDSVFDDNQRFEELREYAFDLLMINFFAEDVQKLEEDYLDSEEWEAIEEETLDRGSELLNILLYLRECADDDVEPSLDDFLKEFLLVEEDEFQDEYRIYEKVIANQILVESNYPEISKIAKGLSEDDELQDLFYPLVSFFNEQNPNADQLEAYAEAAPNKALDLALLQLIINYNS
ncbi:hypothetical protein [Sphingobacterium cellulitidis]|uniref:Uncharacterized protein n=1 Tax=Sphingobacterium cellulitidis TaxID=1768011 RepID=A0A8H9KTN9_9SPHI|nr:hypothetical protein [Sphingobacterium soli]MBA8986910.1 hypothetical protein [Sphingobacterium soli]GGE14874.1 hypothetical protein GCM10011516_10860 [Sphingobacterium soli]